MEVYSATHIGGCAFCFPRGALYKRQTAVLWTVKIEKDECDALDLWATSITSFPIHGNAAYLLSAAAFLQQSLFVILSIVASQVHARDKTNGSGKQKSADIEIVRLSSPGSKKTGIVDRQFRHIAQARHR